MAIRIFFLPLLVFFSFLLFFLFLIFRGGKKDLNPVVSEPEWKISAVGAFGFCVFAIS